MNHPFGHAEFAHGRDVWEGRLFEAAAADHGVLRGGNEFGTRFADQHIKENAPIIGQVDVEIDKRLRQIGFEPNGSTDVVAGQRPSLVTM